MNKIVNEDGKIRVTMYPGYLCNHPESRQFPGNAHPVIMNQLSAEDKCLPDQSEWSLRVSEGDVGRHIEVVRFQTPPHQPYTLRANIPMQENGGEAFTDKGIAT